MTKITATALKHCNKHTRGSNNLESHLFRVLRITRSCKRIFRHFWAKPAKPEKSIYTIVYCFFEPKMVIYAFSQITVQGINMKKQDRKTINVGIVCSPWLGGSGVVGAELARYLAKDRRYKIVFIGEQLPFRLEKEQVIFHQVDKLSHSLFEHPLSETALTEGIVEAVIKYKLDIIHAHFAIPFASCAIQAKSILKSMGVDVSVVTTLHGTDVLNLGPEAFVVMRHILEHSDVVTAVSMDLAARAQKQFGIKKDIPVVYNFVDFSEYPKARKNSILRNKFAKPQEKLFVHVSNFRPIKRVSHTIKVFSKVHSTIPSSLLFIGEGPDISAAKRLAKTMRKQDSIHFIGKVKNPYKYLRIADALLITSEYESFCLAALEAMASGVPVFGTRVGGLPEVVTHGKAGYLADLGDAEKLAGYIRRYFANLKQMTEMKKNALEASKKFDIFRIIPQYEYIYTQLATDGSINRLFGSEKI